MYRLEIQLSVTTNQAMLLFLGETSRTVKITADTDAAAVRNQCAIISSSRERDRGSKRPEFWRSHSVLVDVVHHAHR